MVSQDTIRVSNQHLFSVMLTLIHTRARACINESEVFPGMSLATGKSSLAFEFRYQFAKYSITATPATPKAK